MATLEREVLICYDVSDSRARGKLHESLKGLGLVPTQGSVFWGLLREAEIREAHQLLRQHLDPSTDAGFVVPVGMANAACVGHGPETFTPPARSRVI
jgi:CRISPR-associated endonuclease Cas2